MGFFSKGKNSSKFFKNLDNKIKNLDEDLKKTGVIIDNGDLISSSKNLADQENYSWKKGLIEEEQVKTKEEILEEEVENTLQLALELVEALAEVECTRVKSHSVVTR